MDERITDLDRQVADDPRHPAQALMKRVIEQQEQTDPPPFMPEEEPEIDPQFLFEASMVAGIQELFERLIAIENVVVDIITIVSNKAEQPHSMAEELRSLLLVEDNEPEEN